MSDPRGTNGNGTGPRRYRAGNLVFDGASRTLTIDGVARPIERKPQALLAALLDAAGEPVGRSALLIAAWGNDDPSNDASLMTAMSKLRATIGDRGHAMIRLVAGVGYRIAPPVEIWTGGPHPRLLLPIAKGGPVPSRPHWRVLDAIDHDETSWRAVHAESGERWLFRFARSAEDRLDLAGQADLAQRIARHADTLSGIVPIADQSLEGSLAFLAWSAEAPSLAEFAREGGLGRLAPAVRIGIARDAARILAAAHAVGIAHGGLAADHVVVEMRPQGEVRVRLARFGTAPPQDDEAGGGAPQAGRDPLPPMARDLRALGVLLFQLATGDLGRPPGPDWQARIDDRLLVRDIAGAISRDPSSPPASAAGFAEQLERLDARRAEELRLAELEVLRAANERVRARRPFVIASVLCLAAGLGASILFDLRARAERDVARHEAARTASVLAFLTEDVLGRADPVVVGKPDETLTEAVRQAETRIGPRFATDPATAAAVTWTIAHAFDQRTVYGPAREAYRAAIRLFETLQGPASPDAARVRLQLAMMDAVTGEPGSIDRARALIAQVRQQLPSIAGQRAILGILLQEAIGMLQTYGGDMTLAARAFGSAAERAEARPGDFDARTRFVFRARQAFADMRVGDWATSTAILDGLIPAGEARFGPLDPDVLNAQGTLAMVDMASGHESAALAELDPLLGKVERVFGPDHRLTIKLLGTRGAALGLLERYPEAERTDLEMARRATAKQGQTSVLAIGGLIDAANSGCRAGDATAMIPLALANIARARTGFGDRGMITDAARSTASFCLIVGGRGGEAIPLLAVIDRKAVAQFSADPDYGAELDTMQTEIALDQGRTEAARRLFEIPSRAFLGPNADPYYRRWSARLAARLAEPEAQTLRTSSR